MNPIGRPHFIFSVENPLHNPKIDVPSHRDVLDWLRMQGEDAYEAIGHYGQPEKSIIVINPKNIAGLQQLAEDAGQDSVILSRNNKHELRYVNGDKKGTVVHGTGTKIFSEMPEDMYTTIQDENGDHLYFQHQFGDNSLVKSELKKEAAVKINPEHGRQIADAYEQMRHDPNHPDVKRAYDALINETKQQYQDILKSGIKLSRIQPNQPNPYKNSKEMHEDIEKNNHLWYFPTEQGFGTEGQSPSDHPMLKVTEFKHDDKPLLANDLFRIVHDINGHHKGGRSGFGPTGEHQAYLTHKKMYSPLAAKALATETMGQNNWVNWSASHGEKNRKDPANTTFAEQKAGLLPDHILNGKWHES